MSRRLLAAVALAAPLAFFATPASAATLPPPPAPFVGVGTDSKGGVCVYAFTWVPQCFDQVGISTGR